MAGVQPTAPPRTGAPSKVRVRQRKGGRRRGPGSGWLVVMGLAMLAVLAGAIYALSAGRGVGASTTPAKVEGSLKIDPGQIDAGDQRLGGRPVDASFTLTNVGDKTLTITEAPFIEVVKGC